MLETFTIDTFTPRVGQLFRFAADDLAPFDARLSAVTPLRADTTPNERRTPFSLLFHGALDAPVQQRIFRVEHEHMEPFDLFLVPIGPDAAGMRYEAIFT